MGMYGNIIEIGIDPGRSEFSGFFPPDFYSHFCVDVNQQCQPYNVRAHI